AVVAREREVVVLRQADLRRIDVIETAHGIAAAVRQARVGRRRDAEGIEVGGAEVQIVRDAEVAVPAPEVPDVDGDAARQLALNARRELPLIGPRSPA